MKSYLTSGLIGTLILVNTAFSEELSTSQDRLSMQDRDIANSQLRLAPQEISPQYGTVLSVKPIVEVVKEYQPVKICRETSRHPKTKDSTAGRVVGGIVGAVIGSKMGNRRSQKAVGAVAGAVIGSSIGEAASQSGQQSMAEHHQCRIEERLNEFQRNAGYRVTYRYMGENFQTELPYHPGAEVELRVFVEPVISAGQ